MALHKKQLLDTSHEHLVKRHLNGIKLEKMHPKYMGEEAAYLTVADLMAQSFCVYFTSVESALQNVNQYSQIACGFSSLKDALTKTMFDIASKETAIKVTNSHKEVIHTQAVKIVEEEILHKDAASFQCITTLLPWYDQENKVIGVLGCSIIPSQHDLAASLNQMMRYGLLNSPTHTTKTLLPSTPLDNIYLSKREIACLTLLSKGKTAKKIGLELGLSHRTVEHYIENIKNKAGVSTKGELIYLFLQET